MTTRQDWALRAGDQPGVTSAFPLSPVTQFRPKMAVLLRQSPRGPEPASRSPACEPDPQWGAGERETKTPVYQSQEVPENIRNPGLVPPPRSLCHYRVNIISGCWKTFPLKNYAFLREKKPVPPDFFFKLKKKKKKIHQARFTPPQVSRRWDRGQ